MRHFRRYAALALLLLASASPALADIALPVQPKARPNNEVRRDLPYSRMSIERVEGLREARLQIPRSQLRLLAGVEEGAAGGSLFGSAGTVVAGVFLSLAALLTGLLLVRRTRRGGAGLRVGRAAAALAACASVAGLAAVAAYANAAPPIGYMPQDPGTLTRAVAGAPLAGSIRVEIVEEGGEIKLLVPARARKGGEE